MKLATFRDGSRDGQLVVVSRDLSTAHYASGIATRLQQVLDDWNFLSPQLEDLYTTLNHGKARHAFAFDARQCMAPLPRAFQRVDGAAFLNPVELACRARGAALPASLRSDPLLAPCAGDDLLGATDPIVCASESTGLDFSAELAVVTGDVAMACAPEAALEGVRLLMLANAVTLRERVPGELAKAWGFVHSRPATAYGPVTVTPDELGAAWQGGRVHLEVEVARNGKRVGLLEAGPEMHFHFGRLIAHLCKTRPVRAGSIVGSGTLGNADPSRGFACIADQRALESLDQGRAKTGWLSDGDTVRIEVKGADGQSVFGAIDQDVAATREA